jgi:hypothetical protein
MAKIADIGNFVTVAFLVAAIAAETVVVDPALEFLGATGAENSAATYTYTTNISLIVNSMTLFAALHLNNNLLTVHVLLFSGDKNCRRIAAIWRSDYNNLCFERSHINRVRRHISHWFMPPLAIREIRRLVFPDALFRWCHSIQRIRSRNPLDTNIRNGAQIL